MGTPARGSTISLLFKFFDFNMWFWSGKSNTAKEKHPRLSKLLPGPHKVLTGPLLIPERINVGLKAKGPPKEL